MKCECGTECDEMSCQKEVVSICPVGVGEEKDKMSLSMSFQVADVIKPLVSVKKLTEKGNRVSFGPEEEDNFIENKKTKKRVGLKCTEKGSYLLKVKFPEGDETEIVIDSGAEENVCPKWWGESFGFESSFKPLNLRSASGDKIAHHGARKVMVESSF